MAFCVIISVAALGRVSVTDLETELLVSGSIASDHTGSAATVVVAKASDGDVPGVASRSGRCFSG
jgi:hypothetical protein